MNRESKTELSNEGFSFNGALVKVVRRGRTNREGNEADLLQETTNYRNQADVKNEILAPSSDILQMIDLKQSSLKLLIYLYTLLPNLNRQNCLPHWIHIIYPKMLPPQPQTEVLV